MRQLLKSMLQECIPTMEKDLWLYVVKLAGAAAGAMISLVYLLPRGRREAVSRFFVGLVFGLVFGGAFGAAIADRFGLRGEISRPEIMLTGSAAASICAWWLLGAVSRVAERCGRR